MGHHGSTAGCCKHTGNQCSGSETGHENTSGQSEKAKKLFFLSEDAVSIDARRLSHSHHCKFKR
jgi:hypothetical protein